MMNYGDYREVAYDVLERLNLPEYTELNPEVIEELNKYLQNV